MVRHGDNEGGSSMTQLGASAARPPEASVSVLAAAALQRWSEIVLIEDNSARAARRTSPGIDAASDPEIVVTIHRLDATGLRADRWLNYRPHGLVDGRQVSRASIALSLLDELDLSANPIVVCGSGYGSSTRMRSGLRDRGLTAAVEIRPSTKVMHDEPRSGAAVPARELLRDVGWREVLVPVAGSTDLRVRYAVTELGQVQLGVEGRGRLFAAQTGGIAGVHRGTLLGFSSDPDATLEQLLQALGWVRWIRPLVRRREREAAELGAAGRVVSAPLLRMHPSRARLRANITLSRTQDHAAAAQQPALEAEPALRRMLASTYRTLNVVELFAGAGGMGLGFLMADRGPRYRVVFSGEVNPVYVESLRQNQQTLTRLKPGQELTPVAVRPVDLRAPSEEDAIAEHALSMGGAHVVIGGPPCQGFSNANRNSWRSTNPHNVLVDVYLRYVERLRPHVFVLENVQGIHWTPPRAGATAEAASVLEHIQTRMVAAGYAVFVKLLDAVWYGVPQYRSRFFVLGINRDFGYSFDDFGEWGPFPRPTHGPGTSRKYVTVADAIGDLPSIGNGHDVADMPYVEPDGRALLANPFLAAMREGATEGRITDHVTSRHADYVIERYQAIPEGGNWADIVDLLTNYADPRRTHSNIYRRLSWGEPSVTMGHYRKSMLVHPSQNRGLSLREAARVQSIPDWFRFAGQTGGGPGGIMHKQQQLANAVSPLLTRAVAEYIQEL